jgi:hypothetical protein
VSPVIAITGNNVGTLHQRELCKPDFGGTRTYTLSVREVVDQWTHNQWVDSALALVYRERPLMGQAREIRNAIDKLQASNPFYFNAHPMDRRALLGVDHILLQPNIEVAWELLNSFEFSRKMIEDFELSHLIEEGKALDILSEEFKYALKSGRESLDFVNSIIKCIT